MKQRIIVLALVTVLIPTLALARHRRIPTPTPVPPPVATSTLQLGAYNANVGTIGVTFIGWKDTPSCFAGKTTFIYWESYGYSLDSIISGAQDATIRAFASKVCAGAIVAPFHEMNGNWDPWDGTVGSNTPAKVIQAWKRVHDIVGNKVQWAWVINNSDVPDRIGNRPANYWPGSAYVDIVGVDGFSWSGETFMQSIAPNFSVVKSYGKPVWVTSTGAANNSKQAAWVMDAIGQAKASSIGAILYFSYADGVNFTLNAAALGAFHL